MEIFIRLFDEHVARRTVRQISLETPSLPPPRFDKHDRRFRILRFSSVAM